MTSTGCEVMDKGAITVIIQVAFLLVPSVEVAVITVVPADNPVTKPFESTVAVDGFEDVQVITLFVAL